MAMGSELIPEGARCKPGTVAMLRRIKGDADGRLVVVREPAGYLGALVGSARPVFCWTVRLLGPPAESDGQPSRSLYVPDRCLVPLATMSEEAMKALLEEHRRHDFEAALADLAGQLGATDLPRDVFARLAMHVAEQQAIRHALQVVPVGETLHEIGFKPAYPGGEALQWVTVRSGIELRLSAGPAMFGDWVIAAHGVGHRTLICDERHLPTEGARGQIVQTVLAMWRDAGTGPEPAPHALHIGEVYQRHQADLRRYRTDLPTLYLDAQVFRATRRWLIERHGNMDPPAIVQLDHADGLLRLEVGPVAYGCPAQGVWIEPRSIALSDLAYMQVDVLRRRGNLTLEQADHELRLNGWHLRSNLDA